MSQESMSGLESMGGGAAAGGAITLAQAYAAGAALSDSVLTLDATRGGLVLDATALTGAVFDVKVSGVSKFSVTEAGNLRTAGSVRLDGLGSTGLVKNTNGGNLSIATTADYQVPLVAGVDYQTPLTAGVNYEVPLTFATSDGLSRTVNAIKNTLITGLAGGQTITGGTASGENLTLQSTTNATKGKVYIGAALTVWVDGVNGNPRLNVDGTGLTTTVPLSVKNGKSLSGVEVTVTGTVPSGLVVNDSGGTLRVALGHAVSANDWFTGTAAGDSVIYSSGAAGKQLILKGASSAGGVALRSVSCTTSNNAGYISTDDTNGSLLGYTSASFAQVSSTLITLQSTSLSINAAATMASGKIFAIDSSTSLTAVALQVSGDANTGICQAAGAGDSLSVVLGGKEAVRYTGTAGGGQVGINTAAANSSGITFQVKPHVSGGNAIVRADAVATGAVARYELTSHNGAIIDIDAISDGVAGTIFGSTKALSVSLLSAAATPFFIGSSAAGDVVFGANDVEIFRMDQANSKIKLAAASVSANGTGTVTTGNLAPGTTAVAILEWMAVRTAGGARLIPLYG